MSAGSQRRSRLSSATRLLPSHAAASALNPTATDPTAPPRSKDLLSLAADITAKPAPTAPSAEIDARDWPVGAPTPSAQPPYPTPVNSSPRPCSRCRSQPPYPTPVNSSPRPCSRCRSHPSVPRRSRPSAPWQPLSPPAARAAGVASAVAAATSGAVVVALSAAAAAAASSRVGESATRRRFLARCGQISLRLCRCDAAHTLPTRRIARGVSMRPPPAPGWKTLVICGRCEGVCVAARHALPGWRAPPLLTR